MVFHYELIELLIYDSVNEMNLVRLKHMEHRKDNSMFFSKITEYNQLGFIFNNSFHLLKEYMKCINCYSNYKNNDICESCGYEYSEYKKSFFLNCKNIFPSNVYNNFKKKYNLDHMHEYYYDQRHMMSKFLKMEIYEKALHPDRIEKIIKLSGDSWFNLDKYI